MRFTFDASRPVGSRVLEATVAGKPLDPKAKYTIATTDYVGISGGDGYAMLKEGRVLISVDQAKFDSDVLRTAIVARKVIAPKTDGRIQRLDKVQKKSECDQ
jgi:5'-nucleotidase